MWRKYNGMLTVLGFSQISYDLASGVLACHSFCWISISSPENSTLSLLISKNWHGEQIEGHVKGTLKITKW